MGGFAMSGGRARLPVVGPRCLTNVPEWRPVARDLACRTWQKCWSILEADKPCRLFWITLSYI